MILVDTHVVIWLTMEPERLSKRAAARISVASLEGEGVAVAGVTLWELALLITRRRVTPPIPLTSFLRRVEEKFQVLPITAAIAEASMQLGNGYPKDPMDRIIGATALVEGLHLVTRDEKIRASKQVPTIW